VDSLVGVYGYKDEWNVRDNKSGGGGDRQDRQNNYQFNKRRQLSRSSQRPVVAKGTRMATSRNHNSRTGTQGSTSQANNNRNAWKNRSNNNQGNRKYNNYQNNNNSGSNRYENNGESNE
jgi:hypothetical protein